MGIIDNWKTKHAQNVKRQQSLNRYKEAEMQKAKREMISIKIEQQKRQAKARIDAKVQAIRDAPANKVQAQQNRKKFVRGVYSKVGQTASSLGKSMAKAGANANKTPKGRSSTGNAGGFDKMTNMLGGSPGGMGSGGFGNQDIMSGLGGSKKGKRKGGNYNPNGWY